MNFLILDRQRLFLDNLPFTLHSLSKVSLQFQVCYSKAQLTTIKYVDYSHQCNLVLENHRVLVCHIHQHAMPSLVLLSNTFDVKVFVFSEVLLHLDQLLSQLLVHFPC